MSKVLFKVDDFLSDEFGTNKNVISAFFRFIEIVKSRKIRISLGVIGRTIANGLPEKILNEIKTGIFDKYIELYNHSYNHDSENQNDDDLMRCNNMVYNLFGVQMNIYGAPKNVLEEKNLSWLRKNPYIDKIYKADIPISAYHELENWDGKNSFIQWDNFVSKYQKEHEIVKVYQMHPWVWSEDEFKLFENAVDMMVGDKKEWIFGMEYGC